MSESIVLILIGIIASLFPRPKSRSGGLGTPSIDCEKISEIPELMRGMRRLCFMQLLQTRSLQIYVRIGEGKEKYSKDHLACLETKSALTILEVTRAEP